MCTPERISDFNTDSNQNKTTTLVCNTNHLSDQEYVLIELSNELLDALDNNHLSLRTHHDKEVPHMCLCTETKTYDVLSGTLDPTNIIVHVESDQLAVRSVVQRVLEPVLRDGSIDWKQVPLYSQILDRSAQNVSLEDVRTRNLCSSKEFNELWRINAGFEIDGKACVADNFIILNVLQLMVTSIVGAQESFSLPVRRVYDLMSDVSESSRFPFEVVEAVYKMFSTKESLDTAHMCDWVGTFLLKESSGVMMEQEFLRNWKMKLGLRAEDCSLERLKGKYVRVGPNSIRSLDIGTLALHPKERFAQLFALKREWPLDELLPFINDIRDPVKPVESWIKSRYARISRGMVSPR